MTLSPSDHALFVWAAYGVSLLALLIETWSVRRLVRRSHELVRLAQDDAE